MTASAIVRTVVKRAAEGVLAGAARAGVRGSRASDGRLILVWHNVLPEGELPHGEASLHITRRDFIDQLDVIQSVARVVPLGELLADDGTTSSNNAPRIALTFDDAYAGAVNVGFRELVRRGLPGTLFVAPAFLDGGIFWWDLVASATGGSMERDLRHQLLTELGGDTPVIRQWARDTGLAIQDPPPYARCASTEDVLRLRNTDRISLGAHTWTHANLAAVSIERARDEIRRSLAWVAATGESTRVLSYPYGLSSPAVMVEVERAGAEFALLVEGGWHTRSHNRYSVPRFNIPAGLTTNGLRSRLAALWPVA